MKLLLIIEGFVSTLIMRQIAMRMLVLTCLALSACVSARRERTEQEIVPTGHERALSRELTRNLKRVYGSWDDEKAARVLEEILARVVAADPDYAKVVLGARVQVLGTMIPLVAAGLDKVIYVSRGALAGILYENELAFLLASQLALVKDRAPARNLAALRGQEFGSSLVVLPTNPSLAQDDHLEARWFEPGGLFDFGNESYLKAEQAGIRLAYAAKYDPRGAVTLIQRWTSSVEEAKYKAIGKILPEAGERLGQAREEVAKLSPVRDPIVKSFAFDELQARLRTKKAKNKK